jgi:hypothetical protein
VQVSAHSDHGVKSRRIPAARRRTVAARELAGRSDARQLQITNGND